MRKSYAIALGIILLSFILGVCLYPQMPEKMASHWNAQGEVNGYLPKFWGLFLVPLISVGLFSVIPKIDPLKHNIEEFKKYYDGFVVLVILFLFYVYILTILWNIGASFCHPVLLLRSFK